MGHVIKKVVSLNVRDKIPRLSYQKKSLTPLYSYGMYCQVDTDSDGRTRMDSILTRVKTIQSPVGLHINNSEL